MNLSHSNFDHDLDWCGICQTLKLQAWLTGPVVQGQELEVMRSASAFKRIIYCGDGANDLCPALALLPSDYVLARKVRSPLDYPSAAPDRK